MKPCFVAGIALLAVLLLGGCKGTKPDIPETGLEGVYIGMSHIILEIGTEEGVTTTDTLQADNFEVLLLPNDSIRFANWRDTLDFDYDEGNEYTYWYGNHGSQSFWLVEPDSLYGHFSYFGGWHPTYVSSCRYFSGKKKDR